MNWNYILFDLDGTLTDSSEGIINCVEYALKKMKWPVPDKEVLYGFIGPTLIESFQNIIGMSKEEAVLATEYYRERYSEKGLYENKLYDGIQEILKLLYNNGKKIALATLKPQDFAIKILEYFGIQKYFTVVVGSTFDEKRNTKAQVILEVLNQLHIAESQKSEVIMVGDRKHDILGAKECDIASLGVNYGFAPEKELEENGADYIIDKVTELVSVLE